MRALTAKPTGGTRVWRGRDGTHVEAECYRCRAFRVFTTAAEARAWLDAHRCEVPA